MDFKIKPFLKRLGLTIQYKLFHRKFFTGAAQAIAWTCVDWPIARAGFPRRNRKTGGISVSRIRHPGDHPIVTEGESRGFINWKEGPANHIY